MEPSKSIPPEVLGVLTAAATTAGRAGLAEAAGIADGPKQ